MTSDLRERVAEAIYLAWCKANHVEHTSMPWAEVWGGERKITLTEADAAIAIVLEEAAKVAEAIGPEWVGESVGGSIYDTHKSDEIAAAIRALGEKA